MSRTNKKQELGVSLPLVLGAMVIFSILVFALANVAIISINHSRWALYRTEALAAAEAGAQDYVNRLNGYAAFDSWTAERVKKERQKGTVTGARFPRIVHDSALAQWVSVVGTSNAQYTYDIVGNNAGLIIRTTGRSGPKHEVRRSVEYRITRNSDSAVAYVGNRGFASLDAYVHHAKLFNDNLWEQGGMGVDPKTGRRYTPEEYNNKCYKTDDGGSRVWVNCWRQVWNGYDEVEGNFITRAPQTIHEYKSFMNSARSVDGKFFEYPDIKGSVTIQYSYHNEFTHPSGHKIESAGGTGKQYKNNYYSDQEAAGFRDKETWEYLPYDETLGSSPANYAVIRDESSTFDSCVFRGSTHVILYGDTIYVRSPHTPTKENDGRSDWCKNPTKQLWGRTKTSSTPDISKSMIAAGNFLKPADESTWVKFDDVPPDAVFLVQQTDTKAGCNINVTGDNSSVGKSTGIGFPGSQPSVSTADAGQNNMYNCKNGDLFIEGAAAFRKTFAAEDNIYLTGGIRYTDRGADNTLPVNSDDILGLVAQRNVIVYNPSPITSGNCVGCNKMPRTHYALPTRQVDLTTNEQTGQGALAGGGFDKWIDNFGKPGSIMSDPTAGRPDDSAGWLALPQYDAAIVAEEGAFFLENMNILKDKPTRITGEHSPKPLKVTVNGSVYSKYAPTFHMDRLPTRRGSKDASNPDTSVIEVYGLNMRFLFDKRFTKRLPPGFSGHSDSAYRAQDFAEIFQGHLNP